ncbi:Frigida-like [Parasponia andersonii]|uniref:FRIGIDA-like protein n=1 Tax=Parasponia andersonii TaxID=3476 RepID=A0A2P5DKZ1_PARAD|nr:Frigida-like [Parasponia andersonii]
MKMMMSKHLGILVLGKSHLYLLSEIKHGNLNKDFDELHSRASSEWKELENHLDSTRSSLRTVFEQLVERENEILYREKKLEDREVIVEQLDGIEKLCKELSEELELKKKQHNAVLITIEEKERELSHRQELLCSEIFTVLKASSDPVKLALDAVRGIYHLRLSREDTEFDASIARVGCNLLLELLMKASPEINPQARDEAMKLASDWNDKMKVASYNGLEVLGFLQFLVSFRLVSAFDANEIHSLFDAVVRNKLIL